MAASWVGASAGRIAPTARGSGCHDALVEPGTHDASRQTYLAEERTLLAWWRSGLAAFAVAVGVGALLGLATITIVLSV